MVASTPHWQRLVVLLPVFIIGGGLVLGDSGHKRLIVAGLVALAGAVVLLTYLGVKLPRE
jgi:hypothetical protein